jgi:hypothetical protein
VVDGLFIAVNKQRLKKGFNEDFKGFHFYDIPFCLENALLGVKVGVVTNIRLTHMSIGMISEAWKQNYDQFNATYKPNLPCSL